MPHFLRTLHLAVEASPPKHPRLFRVTRTACRAKTPQPTRATPKSRVLKQRKNADSDTNADLPEKLLVDCEAVEKTRAARPHQIVLAAACARVRRIPGGIASAVAIGMPQLRGSRRAARPVLASVVGAVRIRAAVGLRARQHVVRIRSIANAIY